jgi:hypothetical protein
VLTNFAPGASPDNFSARFEKYVDVSAGTYRFTVTADDGVRISVDGNVVLDQWKEQGPTTYTRDVTLATGFHLVTLDYFDKTQYATLKLTFAPAPPSPQPTPTAVPTGWTAQFWNNTTLSGNPGVTQYYSDINFDWGSGVPTQRVPVDNFSARFTRTLDLAPGLWRFTMTFDDGARLYVNDRLLINRWTEGAMRTYWYEIYLPGGATNVRVEYFELTERAVIKLAYAPVTPPTATPAATPTIIRPTQTPTPVPGEVLLDDSSPRFIKGGPPTGFRDEPTGYNGSQTWTQNNDVQRDNYNYGRWYPDLEARSYEVLVYLPDRFTTTRHATYYISHRDGLTQVVIDQSSFSNQWVSLGTFVFTGSPGDYVSLTDVTGEDYLTTLLSFDAVRFVPR